MSRDPVDEFLAWHPDDHKTDDQWDALLIEEEARREDRERDRRNGEDVAA